MLRKIIKRSGRKIAKSDVDFGHKRPWSIVSATDIIINHASRGATGTNLYQKYAEASPEDDEPEPLRIIEHLPMIRNASGPEERQNLIFRKLRICCVCFDFSDPLEMEREKEAKRVTLVDLVDYIQSGSGKFSEANQEEMVKMISLNIFRCLPPSSNEHTGSEIFDPEEEDPYFDPSWPHLQLVYELLLRYVVSPDTDPKVSRRYIDSFFISNLLELFHSEDPREKEYLKTILHRIYGKFMAHRPFIRKAINNVFFQFIYETGRHSGIGELLEILGSIINGFALPMKEEHRMFLVRALIPLHKPKWIPMYHQHLSYCIRQFVEKDYRLAEPIVKGLLKQWPVINSQKEVLFLGEIEEVLEGTHDVEFQNCMIPLFRQIARCINSPHYQVAERALFLWNNHHITNLILQNQTAILPIIFNSLESNTQSHWNQGIHGLSANVQKMFMDADPELYQECQSQCAIKQAESQELEEKRKVTLQRLAAAAAAAQGG